MGVSAPSLHRESTDSLICVCQPLKSRKTDLINCSPALGLHGETTHMTAMTTMNATTMMTSTAATAPIIAGSGRVSDPLGGDVLGLLLGLLGDVD